MTLRLTTIYVLLLLLLSSSDATVPSQYAKQSVEWFQSEEGRRIADNVLTWQTPHGGWPKNRDTASEPFDGKSEELHATFDNSATTGELRFLARAFRATNEPRYEQAFLKGLSHILEAQYPNGGWPQFYPLSKNYHRHITFNDNAMVRILGLLRDVSESPDYRFLKTEYRTKAEAAVIKGINCILRTQIKQNGKRTAWCAQHDEKTLAPAWARSYEPPSLSGAESVGVVRFLMSLEEPTPEIIAAVEGAVEWFRSVAIHGMRLDKFTNAEGQDDRRIVADPDAGPLWARFYELGSNRPIFLDRDSVVRYAFSEIGQERRTGYAYYGNWAARLLTEDYPQWREKHKSQKE
ncbi:pectate lyase [Candidatus Poribacteria bacterium]|nr:pectate lyase [Candidatus Poribacteria bacterium]MYG06648.1 pectate lyase [Candidatus Poribacteria bacterium]MYK22595.1 pectate lyase [Candidatus Poribacteria bacterium]